MAEMKLNVNDALRIASADKRFAKAFIEDPEAFAKAFNLERQQIESMRDITKRVPIDPLDPNITALDVSYE